MKSMTGFAKGQYKGKTKCLLVEIKSLNGKQLDATVKVPQKYKEKELAIRSMLTGLERGKIDFALTEETDNASSTSLNKKVVAVRYEEAMNLAKELGNPIAGEKMLEIILRQTDVWGTEDSGETDDTEWKAIEEVIAETIGELDLSRKHEGEIMKEDIVKHIDEIERLSKEIPQYEGERIDTAKERIRSWLKDSGVEVDENRFEQELIYYLEKLDITEEKVRLAKHIGYFREVMNGEESCGKKLGFIAQEMGREINTTGSKANHVEIQRLVVGMKDELEKIKEQLGNIL